MRRVLRFVLLLLLSWCVMTFTHESGHVASGLACGGTLLHADLAPWSLPHSHFHPDPYPLVTLWGGPVLGVLVPLALAAALRRKWSWFVAHFCVLANGCYLAAAWFTGESRLDTAKLLAAGASPWAIGVYCAATIAAGYVGFRGACVEALSPAGTGRTA